MFRTVARRLSAKVITLPQLSPTHTQSKIVQWLATEGQYVQAYDLVLEVECSADMVTEGFRERPDETKVMVIDTQDEGVLRGLVKPNSGDNQWMPVGTEIGRIVEDDNDETDGDVDGPWTWQAYLKSDDG